MLLLLLLGCGINALMHMLCRRCVPALLLRSHSGGSLGTRLLELEGFEQRAGILPVTCQLAA